MLGRCYDDLSCGRNKTSCEWLHVMSSSLRVMVIADGLTYALQKKGRGSAGTERRSPRRTGGIVGEDQITTRNQHPPTDHVMNLANLLHLLPFAPAD